MISHDSSIDNERLDRIAAYIKEMSSEVSFLSEVMIPQEDMDYLLKWVNCILFNEIPSESS